VDRLRFHARGFGESLRRPSGRGAKQALHALGSASSISGICPRRIRCALVMMWLPAACLNTSVSRTTGTTPLSIKSPSTVPGPTGGSWSTSPTRTNPARLGTARTSECISGTSTIEVSSTTRRPQASVFDSFLLNRPVAGSISSRRADPSSDFHFVERDDPEKIAATLVKLVQERIPERFRLDSIRDVQILCPMNRGSLGVRELNTALQKVLNPTRPDPVSPRWSGSGGDSR
jgi:hypothetical protein